MARTSKGWTDLKLKRRINQGRGQGEEEYQPWIRVSEVPSIGRVTRYFSRKMNRTIHLLTDMQTMYYYLLEFDDRVVDVKEQFPLLDLVDIVGQLDESLVKRLKSNDGTPHVIVTTFLITAKDNEGNLYRYARSIKAGIELEKKAVLERLEIQRRYFSGKMDWAIVTAEEINYTKSRNIEWVLPALNITDYGMTDEEVRSHGIALCETLLRHPLNPLNALIGSFEREFRLSAGSGLFLFRYLIASKQIEVNMDIEINLNETPEQMKVIVR